MKRIFPLTGAIIAVILVLTALLASLLSPVSPTAIDLANEFAPPGSAGHLLGTGENGVDILAQLIYGTRVSLIVGILTVMVSSIVGTSIGLTAGYFGGIIDEVFMRIVDIMMAFPGILLALAITAVAGPSLLNVVFALAATGWVGYARLVRGVTLSLREREFVLAEVALGASTPRILFIHILPNILGALTVQASFGMAGAILSEAALSFLGLGVPPGTPSWGALLDTGTEFLLIAPHIAIFPGAAIMITVLGFNFLGDGLRDRLDPKSKNANYSFNLFRIKKNEIVSSEAGEESKPS